MRQKDRFLVIFFSQVAFLAQEVICQSIFLMNCIKIVATFTWKGSRLFFSAHRELIQLKQRKKKKAQVNQEGGSDEDESGAEEAKKEEEVPAK